MKLFDRETKFILFGGGAGGGKSWLICEWIIYMCLKYPKTKWFIGRKELKRLMSSTFLTLLKVLDKHSIGRDRWKLNGQYNYMEFFNGSRIDLLDVDYIPSDPMFQRFGSIEYTGGALEEVGEISFGAFDTLKTRIGRHYNREYKIPPKILMTCNPSKNWTYPEFYKPWRDKEITSEKVFIQSLYNDNPYTLSEYGEMLKSITDKILKQRLMFGDWEYESDPMRLFDYEKILDMFSNDAERGQKYLTIDVAGLGRDKTVIAFWDGFYLEEIRMQQNVTAQEVDKLMTERKIPSSNCLIDETGVGFGVVNELKKTYKREVKGFVAGSTPIKKEDEKEIDKVQHNFKNLRSQCWFTLAKYVNSGLIGIYKGIPMETRNLIVEDLEQMKQINADKDTTLQVITKEEIKEKGGLNRSTDCGDVLMQRIFYTFQKKQPFSMTFLNTPSENELKKLPIDKICFFCGLHYAADKCPKCGNTKLLTNKDLQMPKF
jgi:hypothetical protein